MCRLTLKCIQIKIFNFPCFLIFLLCEQWATRSSSSSSINGIKSTPLKKKIHWMYVSKQQCSKWRVLMHITDVIISMHLQLTASVTRRVKWKNRRKKNRDNTNFRVDDIFYVFSIKCNMTTKTRLLGWAFYFVVDKFIINFCPKKKKKDIFFLKKNQKQQLPHYLWNCLNWFS